MLLRELYVISPRPMSREKYSYSNGNGEKIIIHPPETSPSEYISLI